jgi:hypothetical protein
MVSDVPARTMRLRTSTPPTRPGANSGSAGGDPKGIERW